MVSARIEDEHRDCCCLHLRAAVRMYRMLAEEAVAELRRVEGQEGARNAPSRAADDWSARDLADELLTLQPVDRSTPIIEWLASVGLDASLIPVDGARITGGRMLRVQCFEVAADGKRVILADGSGFARTAPRHFEVTTLPPEPWLTEWSAPPADADDDAEWDAREAIERARGGR